MEIILSNYTEYTLSYNEFFGDIYNKDLLKKIKTFHDKRKRFIKEFLYQYEILKNVATIKIQQWYKDIYYSPNNKGMKLSESNFNNLITNYYLN
jgi:hypothetical protein